MVVVRQRRHVPLDDRLLASTTIVQSMSGHAVSSTEEMDSTALRDVQCPSTGRHEVSSLDARLNASTCHRMQSPCLGAISISLKRRPLRRVRPYAASSARDRVRGYKCQCVHAKFLYNTRNASGSFRQEPGSKRTRLQFRDD